MKTKLNIFCICIIATLLLSASGIVSLFIQLVVGGFEAGWEAGMRGENIELPNYQMIYTFPNDNIPEKTGSVINAKDGSELAIKPIMSLVDVPAVAEEGGFSIIIGLVELAMIIGLVYTLAQFFKLIRNINRGIIFDWQNVKRLRKLGFALLVTFGCYFFSIAGTNYMLSEVVMLKGCESSILFIFADPTLILAFVSLLVAEIFAIGLKMQEEQELTI